MEQIPNYLMWREFGTLQAVSTVFCYVLFTTLSFSLRNDKGVHGLVILFSKSQGQYVKIPINMTFRMYKLIHATHNASRVASKRGR